MRYRALDANGDFTFGQGGNNYLVNSSECVAQAVLTRLLLWLGEFFLDTTQGTDWAGSVLGKNTETTRDATLQDIILGTPNVTALVSYSSNLDPTTRMFTVQCTVTTAFSTTGISIYVNQPTTGGYGAGGYGAQGYGT